MASKIARKNKGKGNLDDMRTDDNTALEVRELVQLKQDKEKLAMSTENLLRTKRREYDDLAGSLKEKQAHLKDLFKKQEIYADRIELVETLQKDRVELLTIEVTFSNLSFYLCFSITNTQFLLPFHLRKEKICGQ